MPINPGMLLAMIKKQDQRLKVLEDQLAEINTKQVRDENSRTPEES